MSVIDTKSYGIIVDMSELMEFSSIDCMPLVEYDEEKFESIKMELVNILEVPVVETDIWKGNHTYVYAMSLEYLVGVTDVISDTPRIFVDCISTNADVVYNALQKVVDKFGSPLVQISCISKTQ